jgi:hypothetical protein
VEGYRSYPEGQAGYPEGVPPQQGWYRDGERYDERYEEARHDPGRDPVREAGRPSPAPGPANQAEPIRMAPRPLPQEDPRVARRPPVAPGSPGPMSDGIYRSQHKGAAIMLGIVAAVLELPVLYMLADATSAQSPSGVVAGACLVLALPLLALGLYAVATGAVRAAGPNSAQAWLRPPVAYLSVALVLFVAAGLAAA